MNIEQTKVCLFEDPGVYVADVVLSFTERYPHARTFGDPRLKPTESDWPGY